MNDIKADKKLDIKGVVCPYTLVKTRLAVEDIEVGQVLEVLLDYPEASESIPRAMLNYGHSVLKVEKINPTDWIIYIKKEVED
ncbi:MAG TPA: sulfurtransferase TusA family protein [Nitrospirae bacterium]|nr:sulfurtransferase TusA family protein [Nitrospirota bacterium]HDK41455.1 sulfurtransferase TusA family protein [Nitrospirota bacterium]HDK81095.1 sulfurtransferase TusA family protein [Nitrospirota bacterium]